MPSLRLRSTNLIVTTLALSLTLTPLSLHSSILHRPYVLSTDSSIMVLSSFRPLLLRGTVFRTARAIPVRVAPIRALSLYSPLLKEAAATATATKEAKPKAKKTAVKKSKPKAKPGPKAKKPKKEEKPKKAVKGK